MSVTITHRSSRGDIRGRGSTCLCLPTTHHLLPTTLDRLHSMCEQLDTQLTRNTVYEQLDGVLDMELGEGEGILVPLFGGKVSMMKVPL